MEKAVNFLTFLDLETTSENPCGAEILTAYFRTRNLDDFTCIDEIYLTFRPENYLFDSYRIHKISRDKSRGFNDKWNSFRSAFKYLSKYRSGLFCCHANHIFFGTYGYFDKQVLQQQAFNHTVEYGSGAYWEFQKRFPKEKWISTHTIAKRTINIGNYSLDNIAKFFGFKFNHHDAKADVEATERIFSEMVDSEITIEDLQNLGNYNLKGEIKNGKRSIV